MFDFLNENVKQAIRPVALPLWISLQDTGPWQSLVSVSQRFRGSHAFTAFGVGLPKTGTQSLAHMLQEEYRARHEPEVWILTYLLRQNWLSNETSLTPSDVLRARHDLLNLEFESSWTLGLAIRPLYDTFSDAKYILTIRDPVSWINSEINQQHLYASTKPWDLLSDYRYGPMRVFREEEKALRQYNLHPVDSYFSYWSKHITLVRNTVPDEQLLIVRTRDLSDRISSIADFLDIPKASLDESSSHSHERKEKPLNIQELVDPSYLLERAEAFCGDQVKELFGHPVDKL